MPRKNGQKADLQQLLEDFKTVVRDSQAIIKTGATQFGKKARVGAQSTDRFVRNYPYQTLGLVFGIGFLAGMLASRVFAGEAEPEEY